MSQQIPGVPDHAAPDDARNRAIRTFVQGLVIDALVAVCLVVVDALNQEVVDWRLLVLTAAKTVLMTAASYVMRKLAPPPAPEV